jgi:hypothetical protein
MYLRISRGRWDPSRGVEEPLPVAILHLPLMHFPRLKCLPRQPNRKWTSKLSNLVV